MILHYSSNDFSYKLGDSAGYIKRCKKGFYINTLKNPKYFDNFIFASEATDNYLITTSKNEFVIYKITDEIEKALIIFSQQPYLTQSLFKNIILKFDNKFVRITPELKIENISQDSVPKTQWKYPTKANVTIKSCELNVICNIPILYSILTNAYYPYEGNIPTEYFFQ